MTSAAGRAIVFGSIFVASAACTSWNHASVAASVESLSSTISSKSPLLVASTPSTQALSSARRSRVGTTTDTDARLLPKSQRHGGSRPDTGVTRAPSP